MSRDDQMLIRCYVPYLPLEMDLMLELYWRLRMLPVWEISFDCLIAESGTDQTTTFNTCHRHRVFSRPY